MTSQEAVSSRIYAHPLRRRILEIMDEGTASPKLLARELGEPLGKVSYHVRVLAAGGAVRLLATIPRRGSLEHVYLALVKPRDTVGTAPCRSCAANTYRRDPWDGSPLCIDCWAERGCAGCGREMRDESARARTCSARCRQRVHRGTHPKRDDTAAEAK
jgi:DNA-binding transcriptional ArsR family regulator